MPFFSFTLCPVFLVLSNFRHVYLGFRTTRKEIFDWDQQKIMDERLIYDTEQG